LITVIVLISSMHSIPGLLKLLTWLVIMTVFSQIVHWVMLNYAGEAGDGRRQLGHIVVAQPSLIG